MVVEALEEGIVLAGGEGIDLLRRRYAELRSLGKLRRGKQTISIQWSTRYCTLTGCLRRTMWPRLPSYARNRTVLESDSLPWG
jgi:hypothetical protein